MLQEKALFDTIVMYALSCLTLPISNAVVEQMFSPQLHQNKAKEFKKAHDVRFIVMHENESQF